MKFSESLKKNEDFRIVYRRGRSVSDQNLVMYALKNHTAGNRLGISVSKKVGNSVVRHHLTRLIREVYRLHEDEFRNGWDLVVVVRKGKADLSYKETEGSFLKLADLLKIVTKENRDETSRIVSD